jgi:hypothetical protein
MAHTLGPCRTWSHPCIAASLQVILLLASAPRSPFLRNDLSSGKLQFKVHARELGAQAVQMLDVDLAPLVHLPLKQPAGAAGPLSNGNQTMVIAAVYTVSCTFVRTC